LRVVRTSIRSRVIPEVPTRRTTLPRIGRPGTAPRPSPTLLHAPDWRRTILRPSIAAGGQPPGPLCGRPRRGISCA